MAASTGGAGARAGGKTSPLAPRRAVALEHALEADARFGTGERAIAICAARLSRIGDSIAAALAQAHKDQADSVGPSRAALFRKLRGEGPEPNDAM